MGFKERIREFWQQEALEPQDGLWFDPSIRRVVPEALLNDPEKYIRQQGSPVRPGKIKRDYRGIRDDPTAVLDIPPGLWHRRGRA